MEFLLGPIARRINVLYESRVEWTWHHSKLAVDGVSFFGGLRVVLLQLLSMYTIEQRALRRWVWCSYGYNNHDNCLIATSPLIGWAHTQNYPSACVPNTQNYQISSKPELCWLIHFSKLTPIKVCWKFCCGDGERARRPWWRCYRLQAGCKYAYFWCLNQMQSNTVITSSNIVRYYINM